ncbi:hypothetical protein NEMBOFW57_001521 [Staphylotrichum longicolle]|uniref:CCD97-like C-terminal domain-containing protein n=1 Tax=Staphylotrichum longicolle TaxID=669026 RepID=A0AAD4F4L3_9PEZI|nr:hypothetical protein NEMBOFW57_001521 [Staphylotrichum longicolle]
MAPLLESPPSTPHSSPQPRPRPPRSPGHSAQIRAQNRRRVYLERHHAYLQSSDHELADPLLYDFLIRRFQTPAEREAEGRSKGYARVLEGSLLRGEERLAKLREQTVQRNGVEAGAGHGEGPPPPSRMSAARSNGGGGGGASSGPWRPTEAGEEEEETEDAGVVTAAGFSSLNAELTPPPRTREEGRAQWEEFLRDRFIRGEDGDFEYARVDEDDEFDVLEREEREEAWFEEEDPGWATGNEGEGGGGSGDDEGGGRAEKVLHGETGVQDF